jgi:hypothetical protein
MSLDWISERGCKKGGFIVYSSKLGHAIGKYRVAVKLN